MQQQQLLQRLTIIISCVLAAAAPTAAARAHCRPADLTGKVHCHSHSRKLTLKSSDLPKNTTSLIISNVQDLTITSNATQTALQLHTLVVEHVGSLRLSRDSLRPAATSLRNVTVSHVTTVHLQDGAVAGSWAPDAHLLLRNITTLHCSSRALAASLPDVTLANVSMPRCRPGTFGPGITRLSLQTSHIGSAEPLCVRLRRGVGALTLRQSRVDQLLAMSVTSVTSGASAAARLDRVTLVDSSVGVWQSRAITGRVRHLVLNRTSVQTLETEAVHAAIPEVVFSEVALGAVHTRALAAIHNTTRLHLQAVSLTHAEQGCLVLDKSVHVKGVQLSRVYIGTPCHCDMSSEVIRLTGLTEADGVSGSTQLQEAVARLVMRSAFCAMPGQPSVLARFSEVSCLGQVSTHSPIVDADGRRSHTQQVATAGSDDQTAVFAVVLAGLGVLLLTCVLCAVTRRNRIVAAVRYVTGRPPTSNRTVSRPEPSTGRQRRPRYSTQSSQNSHAELLPSARSRARLATESPQTSHTELLPEKAGVVRGGQSSRSCQPRTELASVSATMERPSPAHGKWTNTAPANHAGTKASALVQTRVSAPLVPIDAVSKTGTAEKTRSRLGQANRDNYC